MKKDLERKMENYLIWRNYTLTEEMDIIKLISRLFLGFSVVFILMSILLGNLYAQIGLILLAIHWIISEYQNFRDEKITKKTYLRYAVAWGVVILICLFHISNKYLF
ncbi:hypothetical protein WMO40_13790 [Bacillaceae bacterium CLA-AA-H227]|uniref:Uncharacterized protein n=1 Tax=Robertmurraya yapensis (ex Hitch et al 2024) TaxID=3133160 RepID=A0ACC6SCH3_9BACI